ncbi:claudin-4 [Echinops telfairi]|uniref:Claudin n=1 Tax=Echinops telfairi TaxID=9371 RepID=A0ABM0IQX4_ECHTE|nr:claudin-4 [Echinops telfairi]
MASMGLQVMGVALAVLGWLGVIVSCALPMWRVTAFIGSSILTAQVTWEGLWMNCVVQSTGQLQCKMYDSLLALPQDLQAARALMVVCIIMAAVGVLLSVMGGKCTNCVEDETAKAKTMIGAGVVFLLACLLVMVPVSWTAHNIIRDFYNPVLASSQKREMGAALYIGWASAGLLLLGGAMLCCNCPPRNDKAYSAKYSAARSGPTSNYV